MHETKQLVVVTHVDDFLCAGSRADLDWRREFEFDWVSTA